jgi:heme-degrading monooxygenase HmoA
MLLFFKIHTMQPPYYAVIFTSKRKPYTDGYEQTAERMKELTAEQPGFLGIESARNVDGLGITVCYWNSIEAIKNWKANTEHQYAQQMGKSEWYESYCVRIAKVEEEYSMEAI